MIESATIEMSELGQYLGELSMRKNVNLAQIGLASVGFSIAAGLLYGFACQFSNLTRIIFTAAIYCSPWLCVGTFACSLGAFCWALATKTSLKPAGIGMLLSVVAFFIMWVMVAFVDG